MASSADGKLVATGSWEDKAAVLWDIAGGKNPQTFGGHRRSLSGVALSGDGRLLATGSYDETAVLWDTASGKKLKTFPEHADGVTSVALSGDGKRLVTAVYDNRTGKTISQGGMGIIAGYFLPEDEKEFFSLRRDDG